RGGGVDVAEVEHSLQHVPAARGGQMRMDDWVVKRRRLRNTRERGGLGHRQLIEALAVVGLRRGRYAVGALAEEDLVEIKLEDLLLGELVIHLVGDDGLLQLP